MALSAVALTAGSIVVVASPAFAPPPPPAISISPIEGPTLNTGFAGATPCPVPSSTNVHITLGALGQPHDVTPSAISGDWNWFYDLPNSAIGNPAVGTVIQITAVCQTAVGGSTTQTYANATFTITGPATFTADPTSGPTILSHLTSVLPCPEPETTTVFFSLDGHGFNNNSPVALDTTTGAWSLDLNPESFVEPPNTDPGGQVQIGAFCINFASQQETLFYDSVPFNITAPAQPVTPTTTPVTPVTSTTTVTPTTAVAPEAITAAATFTG